MTTITPKVFCTRRVAWSKSEYERIANMIKRYGCVVSKVSDGYSEESGLYSVLYFDIPKDSLNAFLIEEAKERLGEV
jgi:hypothetical protein